MRVLYAVILASFSVIPLYASGAKRRDITVKDAIEMTRWADGDYLLGADPDGNIGNFAPDGKHFVIVLRKADLARNVNVYSVYLFATGRVFDAQVPRILLRMNSSSNEPAIRGLKWLKDSRSIAFVGVRGLHGSEVYTLDTGTGQLIERTHHRTGVDQFDISPDGTRIVFTARPEDGPELTRDQRLHGVVIEDQPLEQVIAGKFNQPSFAETLFYQDGSEHEVKVPSDHQINPFTRIWFSPNGEFAGFTADFRQPSSSWLDYRNEVLKFWGRNPAPVGGASPVFEYFLFDCSKLTIRPVMSSPSIHSAVLRWAPDSRSIYVKTFLPLEGASGRERAERQENELPARISIPSLRMRRIPSAEWDETLPAPGRERPQILMKEDLNTAPEIVAQNPGSAKSTVILELNPQFSQLRFGQVEELRFSVDGVPILAGMYLPPDYVPTRRYPLVVQTHGFDPKRFSMDGRSEWSSGFAARALAASGVIVVQMYDFADQADHDKVGANRSLGRNLEQSFRNFSNDCFKQVVRDLDEKGVIEPDRVGISGFSRTVWFVSYLLTHTTEPKFRAAVLTDGIDGGYFDYIAERLTEFSEDNGGLPPFGPKGLELWMNESPGFQLDRVHIPVRLVSIEDRLSQWEWFAAGKMQQKPVELVEIPGGSHILERPGDRQIAMQGIVDWFRFWLQDATDPDPDKREQYARWERLKTLESKQDRTGGTK